MPSLLLALLGAMVSQAQSTDRSPSTVDPLLRTVDLDVGEARRVTLQDGSTAQVRLLNVDVEREAAGSIYAAQVTVEVNGERATLGGHLQPAGHRRRRADRQPRRRSGVIGVAE